MICMKISDHNESTPDDISLRFVDRTADRCMRVSILSLLMSDRVYSILFHIGEKRKVNNRSVAKNLSGEEGDASILDIFSSPYKSESFTLSKSIPEAVEKNNRSISCDME